MVGRCCEVGKACINPGLLSENFCCDRSLNTPCGGNGDGAFEEGCPNRIERRHNGRCVPKDECPGDRLTAQGVCCPTPEQPCRRSGNEGYGRPDGQVCCALHTGGEGCCDAGRCLSPGPCCADDNVANCAGRHGHRAPIGHECCGEYGCPPGTNGKC